LSTRTKFVILLTAIVIVSLIGRHLYHKHLQDMYTARQIRLHLALVKDHAKWMKVGLKSPPTYAAYRNGNGKGSLSIGVVGDSISFIGTPSAPEIDAQLISRNGSWRSVSLTNAAVPASETQDWLPSSRFPLLKRAEDAFVARNVSVVVLMLGENDAWAGVSPVTYRANLLEILTSLTRHRWRVIINQPPAHSSHQDYMTPDFILANKAMNGYRSEISSLCTGRGVLVGDTTAFGTFLHHPELLSPDKTHPNSLGLQTLGHLWASAALRELRK